eukprot:6165874-Amphidinium_carterae.1
MALMQEVYTCLGAVGNEDEEIQLDAKVKEPHALLERSPRHWYLPLPTSSRLAPPSLHLRHSET